MSTYFCDGTLEGRPKEHGQSPLAKKKPVLLRIDPELWSDLNQWARDELRSLNGQMEYLLREAVKKQRRRKKGT